MRLQTFAVLLDILGEVLVIMWVLCVRHVCVERFDHTLKPVGDHAKLLFVYKVRDTRSAVGEQFEENVICFLRFAVDTDKDTQREDPVICCCCCCCCEIVRGL